MEKGHFGPFRLLNSLGEGATAEVWLAEVVDPEGPLRLGEQLAVKVFAPRYLEHPSALARCRRETESLRRIQHRNVVRLVHAGEVRRGDAQRLYLAMEIARGETLKDLVERRERMPEPFCLHLGREVAEGLTAIHGADLIHRDIKPANVVIVEDPPVVRIMDFGSVHALLNRVDGRLTQEFSIVGTPRYLAPEQIDSRLELGGTLDLFALGIVLYELATGEHPWPDCHELRDYVEAHQRADPVPPRRCVPELSPFFESVVLKLLEKSPGDRFRDAGELRNVLRDGTASTWWQARLRERLARRRRPQVQVSRDAALRGRDRELGSLRTWAQEAATGTGRVVLVRGEAGIGKSRLLDEWIGRLSDREQPPTLLYGGYPPGGSANATGAFCTALREHLGRGNLESALGGLLAETPALVPAFAGILRGEPPPAGASPLEAESLRTAFVRAVQGLAHSGPVVIVIDDLHYAPAEGRAIFTALAHGIQEDPVLLVGTTRPELPGEWTTAIENLPQGRRLTIGRLDDRAVTEVLEEVLGDPAVALRLAPAVSRGSDGIPFLVMALIRAAQTDGTLEKDEDGHWQIVGDVEALRAPELILDLIRAQLRRVEAADRELLDAAAVIGFTFDPKLLAHLLDRTPIEVLRQLARIERDGGFVRGRASTCVFDHHQVHEVLYADLGEALRAELHALVAEALQRERESVDPSSPEAHGLAVRMCEHQIKGGRGAGALSLLDTALDHLEQGFLRDEALKLAEAYLAVPGLVVGVPRGRLLLRAARTADVRGVRSAEERLLEEAAQVAEAAGDEGLEGAVAARRGMHEWKVGRLAEAEQHTERAERLARRIGDPPMAADAALLRLILLRDQGQPARAVEICRPLIEEAHEAGRRTIEGRLRGTLGNLLSVIDQDAEAEEHLLESLRLLEEGGDALLIAKAAGNLGWLYAKIHEPSAARPYFERHLELSRRIGYRSGEARALGNLADLMRREGRLREALDLALQDVRIEIEVGDSTHEAIARYALAETYGDLGAYEEAWREASVLRDLGARMRDSRSSRKAEVLLAQTERDTDRAGAACARLQSVADGLPPDATPSTHRWVAARLAMCLRASGATESAARLLESILAQAPTAFERSVALVGLAALGRRADAEAAEALEAATPELDAVDQVLLYGDLYRVTRREDHLTHAHRVLMHLHDHAPEPYRASMLERVPAHRAVIEAWHEFHGGGPRGGP